MADLNKSIVGGRLFDQPQITTSHSQATGELKKARFKLACHRPVRDENQPTGWSEVTDSFTVVCFGRLADRAERLNTGAYVTVSGRLQTYEYSRTVTTEEGIEVKVQVLGFEVVADDLNQVVAGREREREAIVDEAWS